MSTISPPPWTFKDEHGTIYDARGDMPILYCASKTKGLTADGNGALVAAAPDLQAALRELVARVDICIAGDGLRYEQVRPMLEPELTAARAALAKSEKKP